MGVTRKKKKIKVSSSNINKLAQHFGVCRTAVWNALAFRSYSALSEKIRKQALENYGGKEVQDIIFIEN
jgi:hypothetical protein